MNSILPFGNSRLDTNSSKFNLDTGNVLIGLDAGTQLQNIDNVFIGNSAGSKSTMVSESIFLGIYAGQNIVTGKKSIIIGDDQSTSYINKENIVSIGYNKINNDGIGIGSNITSSGINNIAIGKNISCYANNAYSYGKNLMIKNSEYFFNSLLLNDNNILLDGFNTIGLLDIKSNTNYYLSSNIYISYDFNNYIKYPDTIFTNETDIIFQFKPKKGVKFDFNLGFYKGTCNIVNFNFKQNSIIYTNRETSMDINYTMNTNNKYIYDTYNTIHIINNDKNYRSLSLFINPSYNGYVINTTLSTNYAQGLINNISDLNINSIRLEYVLDDTKNIINSNYIYSDYYRKIYHDTIITSNITSSNIYNYIVDYETFNNASSGLTFKNFIISINDVYADNYNVVYGKDINVTGKNNICIGDNQNIDGNNSVIIGNSISSGKLFKNCTNSLVIGTSNLINNFAKNLIVLGNNNYTETYNDIDYYNFLSKKPVILGNNINSIKYNINICDTIVKYDDTISSNELLLTGKGGKYSNFLPVAIGYSDIDNVPIKNIYKLKYVSNIYNEVNINTTTSNYFVDNQLIVSEINTITSNTIVDINPLEPKVLNDDLYSLYIKEGLYTDLIGIYNNSNYNIELSTWNDLKKNIKYSLPITLDTIDDTNPHFLSYINEDNGYNKMYWNTFENAFLTTNITTKSLTTTQHITSYNFIGVGSNLYNINLNDRDTSLLKEGSNLYFTQQRAGAIADASNIKAMNYTLLTSNEILNKISKLTTDDISEGTNLYYTPNLFEESLLTKTLDNIYNGTSNRYITNDIYTNSLLITGTLTVGKIQVLGVDFPTDGNQVHFASQDEVTILKQKVDSLTNTVNILSNRILALENA